MAKSFVFQNTKDFAISPYKNVKMFKSVFENQISPWKNEILHPDFFFWLGMDLYLLKIATILSQSRLAGLLKFFGPKRYTNNFFWRAPHVRVHATNTEPIWMIFCRFRSLDCQNLQFAISVFSTILKRLVRWSSTRRPLQLPCSVRDH